MSVLVAHSHDALVPRKRTSSFSFPLRPSKAPRLGLGSQSMGGGPSPRSAATSTTGLRRTETYASLTELLLEAVSTPSPSPPTPTPASTSAQAKQPPAPPKGKDIPYTRTLQYQQDQRLARRRKAHALVPPPARSDTLPDLSTPVAVAAHSLKEPLPTPAPLTQRILSPAPQRIARVRSKGKSGSSSSKEKGKERKKGVPANQQRQPTPPSHYRLSLALSSSSTSSSSPASSSSPSPHGTKRRPTPQVILPTSTSQHAIPLLLTPRTTSPLRPSSSPPLSVPGRPVFPRSKKDVAGQLRKIACVRRMEGTERGRTMKAMGVRGAVEVWRATVELEALVGRERGKQGGEGEGDDDMDVDAEGDTDDECDVDPFEDVEIDGPVKREGQGVKLGSEWVVVPGEDWEMVDCAVA